MFAIGKKAYFVPSLHEKSIPGIVTKIETFHDKITWIEIRTSANKTIKGYANQFSDTKPAIYNITQKANLYSSIYWNQSENKPVTLAQLKESYEYYKRYNNNSFDEYMRELLNTGCFVPYSEYMKNNIF